jgi:hypothetical protein
MSSRWCVPAAALILVAAACGEKAKVVQAGAPAAGAPASATAKVAGITLASFDPATHRVILHTKDFSFDAPDTITAGWTTFHLVNDGPSLHHVQLVRLDSGKTAQDLRNAMMNPGPPPRWAAFVGGPNAPNPGSTSDAMLELQPGSYALLCLVDIPDHVPHFAKGMFRQFTVLPANGPSNITAPSADVTITLADYNFVFKGPLTTAGAHTIRVDNAGPQPHEVEIIRFAPGKTPKDLAAWMAKPNGPPPGDAIGGIVAQMAGTGNQYFITTFVPGHYALLCFIPDMKDGKPHVDHGMVREFDVK